MIKTSRNQEEYDQYKNEVTKRHERIGYFQNGTTFEWYNAGPG